MANEQSFKTLFSKKNYILKIITLFLISLKVPSFLNAQVVSPELRRLSISTNQFGIDVLKALDRIEPPDKVLVFCPVCLSSSLMMIMMGSSKYPVVSSLRHALYVWSMKPHEINKGFKDIFQHIGLNQQQQLGVKDGTKQSASLVVKKARVAQSISLPQLERIRGMGDMVINESFARLSRAPIHDEISLPKMIRTREMLEKGRLESGISWWDQASRRSDMTTNEVQQVDKISGSNLTKSDQLSSGIMKTPNMSQMSALSNVYMQRGLTVNYNYNLLLRENYKTVIHPVDFIRNAEETRQHINSLVAVNTEGKIKDLVKKEALNMWSVPKIMMISTFHLRGTLDIEMKHRNQSETSHQRTGKAHQQSNSNVGQKQQSGLKNQAFIQTEPTLLKFGQFSNFGCSVVEIPFSNRLVTLIVIMPNHRNSTEILLTKLSGQVLNDFINSLVVRKLSVEIPIVKFDRGPVNVEGLIRELGLDHIFFGDKIQSTETGPNRWMRPSNIIHETSIDIGTINPDWPRTEDRLKAGAHISRSNEDNLLRLDKPFFYFVLDSISGLVLTMGRIRQ